MLQEVFKSVNAEANWRVFSSEQPIDWHICRLASEHSSKNTGTRGICEGEYFRAIFPVSLHFIGAASKLALLHWGKGNTLGC
jgi:hypothetical protein